MYDIDYIERRGKDIINDYIKTGIGWSIIPVVSSLALNPIILDMISKINKMAGINTSKRLNDELLTTLLTNIVMTPLASIPLFGIAAACACISASGDSYLSAVIYAAKKANETFEPIEGLLKDALKNGNYPKYKFVSR